MSKNGITNGSQTARLESKVETLENQLADLSRDIQFIKKFFVEKQDKRERRRQRKEAEQAKLERQQKEQRNRAIYEDIIWRIGFRLWALMPYPRSILNDKEMQVFSLLAQGKTEEQIADIIGISAKGVSTRICVAIKRHKKGRKDLIEHYRQVQEAWREHRRKKCLWLVYWLLNPPPGIIHHRNLEIGWKRRLGRSKTFKRGGPFVPLNVFDEIKQREHTVLKLRAQGFDYETIAQRLKIKKECALGYVSEVRSNIKSTKHISLSEDAVLKLYTEYLKLIRKRSPTR